MEDENFYSDLMSIPTLSETKGCSGWIRLSKDLNITTIDGNVNNIECWIYHDDVMFVRGGRIYHLPKFTSYFFK